MLSRWARELFGPELFGNRRWNIGLVVAFLLLAPFIVFSPHATKSLEGWGTDHISHIATVPMFLHHGFRIYSEASEELEPNPGVIQTNWRQLPRPYPPLNLIYHAPEAALAAIGIPPGVVIGITMLVYLAVSLLLVRFYAYFIRGFSLPGLLSLPALAVIAVENVKWAMNGFYDAIAILPLLASFYFGCRKRDYALGFFAYCLSVGLHFRALWYLPVGLIFGYRALRTQALSARTLRLLLGGTAIGLLAAYVLYLGTPGLLAYPINNVFYHATTRFVSTFVGAVFIVGWITAYCIARRKWVALATTVWMLFFLTLIRQNMVWHSVFLLPLSMLVLTESSEDAAPIKDAAGFSFAFGFYLYLATNILYTAMPLNFDFFRQLWLDGSHWF